MRILFYILFLFCVCVTGLYSENIEQIILILPFINTGVENENLDESLFISYFYVYFEQLKNFNAVHPYKILNYIKENTYNTNDLYTIDNLNTMMNAFHSDFILGGEYKIEKGILKISIDIFGKQRKMMIKKNFEAEIQTDERNTLNQIVIQTTKAFSGYDPDTGTLIVNTEYPCAFYINDAFFGMTPKRFILPSGEYDIKIVFENYYFNEIILQKHILLTKDQIYDLGEIPVLITYEIKANVEAGIFYNNKKIGVTDLFLQFPIGHDYELEIIYTDIHNEKRSKKDIISTKDGKNGKKEYEFTNRVKMDSGFLPLYGKVGTETAKLPYIFDNLETGTHKVQMFMEDLKWKRNWIIFDKKMTLNIAETVIIDKSDFIYHKYWGLCFIPAAAQFYNFESMKGYIILSIAGTALIESIITGCIAIDHYNNVYLPAKNNNSEDYSNNDFKQIINTQNILTITALSGIGLFGAVYIYSCVDGIMYIPVHPATHSGFIFTTQFL